MNCALWLGGKKVFSADEICNNFDIAAVRGYFLGGSLVKWLMANGGERFVQQLNGLDPKADNLNDRLTEIFTGRGKNDVPTHRADENVIAAVENFKSGAVPVSGSYSGSFGGSFRESGFNGSFSESSYNRWLFGGSFSYGGALNFGSFSYGSYNSTSFGFRLWEWEWEWILGSFRKNYGSFSVGSFTVGSFNVGSFNAGSFKYASGSFSFGFAGGFGYKFGEYKGVPVNGSYRPISSDEYDEIMYRTLNMCPLNRFGYGIHLI